MKCASRRRQRSRICRTQSTRLSSVIAEASLTTSRSSTASDRSLVPNLIWPWREATSTKAWCNFTKPSAVAGSRVSRSRESHQLMMQAVKSILLVISALFPIVDPIGGSPIFLGLTKDYAAQTRRLLARRIAINSFVLLVASFTIGSHVLAFFGISLPVVQVGGGLIVISTGWEMLKQNTDNDRGAVGRTVNCTDALRDAFYPLTLPLTVGPGSISIAITLGANERQNLRARVVAI